MAKTVTLRIDDETYSLIKSAAIGERRSISNFIEYATLGFLTEESFISDNEMDDILKDEKLLKSLAVGNKELEEGKYRIVG
ncbi:MAG: CopG family transcriptional regulator [Spirochaetes bacterium]|nr:MAG: CopG family transcriptional regulator [Spirochaetota bacterium]RKX95138.1 MAG: CopG family transcriptional regulator [Spirochaetota bacterium]